MTRLLAATLLWTATLAASGPGIYVIATASPEGPSQFGRLDPSDGSFFLIRNYEGVFLGVARSADQLYTVDGDGVLYRIETASGTLVRVGVTGVAKGGPLRQAFYVFGGTASGGLYGIDSLSNLWRVNRESGVASMVGATGLPPIISDRSSTSLSGDNTNLFVTYEIARPSPEPPFPLILPPTLYRIDPSIGRAVPISAVPSLIFGSAFAGGKLYAFPAALDPDSGELTGNDNVLEIDVRTGLAKPLAKPGPCMGFGYGGVPAPAPVRAAANEARDKSTPLATACRGKGFAVPGSVSGKGAIQ